jgi:hypothetical protein
MAAHQAKLIGDDPLAPMFSMAMLPLEQWLLLGLVNATIVVLSVS